MSKRKKQKKIDCIFKVSERYETVCESKRERQRNSQTVSEVVNITERKRGKILGQKVFGVKKVF